MMPIFTYHLVYMMMRDSTALHNINQKERAKLQMRAE
jgi:hypothetical protein